MIANIYCFHSFYAKIFSELQLKCTRGMEWYVDVTNMWLKHVPLVHNYHHDVLCKWKLIKYDVLYFQLHYLRLPKDIKESHVMLMDATVATGAAAMMAIRVLLDHDVPQENIILLSMLMGDSGMSHLHRNARLSSQRDFGKIVSLILLSFLERKLSWFFCLSPVLRSEITHSAFTIVGGI